MHKPIKPVTPKKPVEKLEYEDIYRYPALHEDDTLHLYKSEDVPFWWDREEKPHLYGQDEDDDFHCEYIYCETWDGWSQSAKIYPYLKMFSDQLGIPIEDIEVNLDDWTSGEGRGYTVNVVLTYRRWFSDEELETNRYKYAEAKEKYKLELAQYKMDYEIYKANNKLWRAEQELIKAKAKVKELGG